MAEGVNRRTDRVEIISSHMVWVAVVMIKSEVGRMAFYCTWRWKSEKVFHSYLLW